MSKSRRRFSAEFKFEVALEAAKGLKTLNELSSQFGVHPNQVSDWKRELFENGTIVFSNPSARQQREREALQSELYEQVGRLQMELEWLKKKAARHG
jgi:putative transposase